MAKEISSTPRGATPRPVQRPTTTTTRTTTTATRTTARRSTQVVRPFQMPFESKNVMIILAGVGVIALGYIIMAMSPTMSGMALTVSPIVLLIGYCVVVPYGIMYGARAYSKGKQNAALAAAASANGIPEN